MFEYIFVIFLILILIIIIISNNYEKFDSNDENLFYQPIPNIFLTSNNLNYINNKSKQDTNYKSLGQISYDSYINSDTVANKIICLNYTNEADCWQNNHCEWVYKIHDKSFCQLAKKTF